MEASTEVGELAKALSKAQGEFSNAKKDENNPFFKSKYADLASVKAATQDALSANGLSVVQLVGGGTETVRITTRLMHTSGQWVQESLELKPTKADPQGMGSAATYGRRYTLMGILNVAPDDDDDGNAASRPVEPKKFEKPKAVEAAKHPDTEFWYKAIGAMVSSGQVTKEDILSLNHGEAGSAYKKDDHETLKVIHAGLGDIIESRKAV